MKTLLVGYKAADLAHGVPEGDVTVHVLDVYHKHAIEKTLPGLNVVCMPHLPEGPWDVVKFKTGPKLMSGELSLDLLQEISRLVGGDLRAPRFELDFVGKERDRNELVEKIMDDPDRVRSFRATWPASVPGGEKMTFASYPGCFCHRRMDEGGLALAEVVSRELVAGCQLSAASSGEGLRLLDMGCGCGLVGLLVAGCFNRQTATGNLQLTLIDSHARAVEAAQENAAAFGIPAEVVMTDDGIEHLKGAKHAYDIFVGNPPYYSDYRIADVFLDTAKKALKHGGACYTVCKNAAGLEPVQRRYFPEVEVIRRRGYAVLKSVAS